MSWILPTSNVRRKNAKGKVELATLDAALADLAFWFGFSHSDLEEMTLDDIERWLTQAQRQIKANYTKAAI